MELNPLLFGNLNDFLESDAALQKNRLTSQCLKLTTRIAAVPLLVAVASVDPIAAQQDDRVANCTEKLIVYRVNIGHDCEEFASVLIAGNVVIQRPWSRVNRASRAARIRARREGRVTGTAEPPTPVNAPSAAVIKYGIDVSGGSNPDDLDCEDFATQAEAQGFFDQQGWSATNDPARLDQGGEPGVPCENLP